MGKYDRACKSLVRRCPQDILALFAPPQELVFQEHLPQDLAVPDRDLDTAMKVQWKGNPAIFWVEFQSKIDPKMPQRMFEYITLLHLIHKLPVLAGVAFLKPNVKQKEIPQSYQMKVEGYTEILIKYKVQMLWEIDPEPILEHGPLGLLPLVGLMKGATEATLRRAMARIESDSTPEQDKPELAAILYMLSGLIFPIEILKQIVRRKLMSESVTYQEILKEGEELGLRKGEELGLRKGEELGLRKGEELGLRKGILTILNSCFGELSVEIKEQLNQIHDIDKLQELARQSVRCKDLEEFKSLLG